MKKRELKQRIADLERLVFRKNVALTIAAKAFDSYAAHHANKTPPDESKVLRNSDLCNMCRIGASLTEKDLI